MKLQNASEEMLNILEVEKLYPLMINIFMYNNNKTVAENEYVFNGHFTSNSLTQNLGGEGLL